MKRIFLILVLALPFMSWAQPESESLSPEKRKQIEGMKVGYLTAELDLTPEEAQVFWPVYNEFSDKLEAHRKKARKQLELAKSSADELTDAEIEELIQFRFDHERERIDLEEEYYEKFLEVLPTKKVGSLMKAENDFKRYLLKQMRSERQQRGRPGR